MSDQSFSKKNEQIKNPVPVGHNNRPDNVAYADSVDERVLPEQFGQHARAANIEDFLDILHLCLKGYQSYFVQASPGIDDSLIYFPFAWYLNKDDRIFNKTTGAEYKVQSLETKIGENVVSLVSGTNAPMPVEGDVLLFDFDNIESVKFVHSYPNSDDVNRYFTEEQIIENSKGDFSDTISYRTKVIEPTKIGNTQQLSPRRVGSKQDPKTGSMETMFVEQFDSVVSFQCWTKTNERTTRFARWFRAFMTRYRSIFKVNGVQEVVFTRQGSEFNVTRWRNDIIGTTLNYSVRTQEHSMILETQLKGFQTSLQLLSSDPELGERIETHMDIESIQENIDG